MDVQSIMYTKNNLIIPFSSCAQSHAIRPTSRKLNLFHTCIITMHEMTMWKRCDGVKGITWRPETWLQLSNIVAPNCSKPITCLLTSLSYQLKMWWCVNGMLESGRKSVIATLCTEITYNHSNGGSWWRQQIWYRYISGCHFFPTWNIDESKWQVDRNLIHLSLPEKKETGCYAGAIDFHKHLTA